MRLPFLLRMNRYGAVESVVGMRVVKKNGVASNSLLQNWLLEWWWGISKLVTMTVWTWAGSPNKNSCWGLEVEGGEGDVLAHLRSPLWACALSYARRLDRHAGAIFLTARHSHALFKLSTVRLLCFLHRSTSRHCASMVRRLMRASSHSSSIRRDCGRAISDSLRREAGGRWLS